MGEKKGIYMYVCMYVMGNWNGIKPAPPKHTCHTHTANARRKRQRNRTVNKMKGQGYMYMEESRHLVHEIGVCVCVSVESNHVHSLWTRELMSTYLPMYVCSKQPHFP